MIDHIYNENNEINCLYITSFVLYTSSLHTSQTIAPVIYDTGTDPAILKKGGSNPGNIMKRSHNFVKKSKKRGVGRPTPGTPPGSANVIFTLEIYI